LEKIFEENILLLDSRDKMKYLYLMWTRHILDSKDFLASSSRKSGLRYSRGALMEYFELYDPEGNPTGKTECREKVHAEGLWHATVHVWIYNLSREILMQRRSLKKDSHPGFWDISAAGHISPGETPGGAATREIEEELGLRIAGEELVFLGRKNLSLVSKGGRFIDREITYIYLCRWEGTLDSLKLDKEEVDTVSLFSLKKLEDQLEGTDTKNLFVPHGEDYYRWIIVEVKKRTTGGAT
jgi:isopentenyl-diphosphate delta-isomerase